MSSTIAQVRLIESQQLCSVIHHTPGTFCGSNMKLVANLFMRPLHFTALSSRSGVPPNHPHYLHHNAMRTIQSDLLLKMAEVFQLQLIHWCTSRGQQGHN